MGTSLLRKLVEDIFDLGVSKESCPANYSMLAGLRFYPVSSLPREEAWLVCSQITLSLEQPSALSSEQRLSHLEPASFLRSLPPLCYPVTSGLLPRFLPW